MRRTLIIMISLLAIVTAMAAQPKKSTKKKSDPAAEAATAAANAKKSLYAYDLDAATEYVDEWEEAVENQKKDKPEAIDEMRSKIVMTRNMLERVEKIEIVDTLHVDSLDFIRYYKLSADAGTLNGSDLLPDEYAAMHPKVVYMPQSEKEMLWGMPTDSVNVSLAIAKVLDDGTVEEPRVYDELIDGNIDYPFMLQDGVTVYFGATGDNSLGGYDIFMTRRDEDGEMLQPQNLGMPYNSPYNDYMLVIDETASLGWWASDREGIPGKVTIYVFVPSKMRTNYEWDEENINAHALLSLVEPTGDLEARLPKAVAENQEDTFYLPMGNGKVYTTLSDFKAPQARQAMRNVLKRMEDLEVAQVRLDELRAQYAAGDKTVATEILRLEKSVQDTQKAIKRNTNQVIAIEMRQ